MFLLKHYKNQLFKYVLVAGANVMAGYGVFAFLIFLKFHYILACTLATIFGILFGFKTFSFIVFNNKNNWLIFKYLIVWAIVYILNIAGLIALDHFKINNYTAGFIMLFPLAALGFLLNKKWVFKQVDYTVGQLK